MAGCTSMPPATVSLSGQIVLLNGLISKRTADEFAAIVASHTVRRLVITSGGGHVAPALDMEELIFAKKIDVEVPFICLSSCANYIFPAGNQKYSSNIGLVGWHGNVTHRIYLPHSG